MSTTQPKANVDLRDRLQPAPVNPAFSMEGSWVWCGSVVRGDDGRFHMFASRWPHDLAFSPHWLTNSQIVRAVAQRAEGPYHFQEVVLPPREGFWDGRMTHNPAVQPYGQGFVLFYTGTTYEGPTPTAKHPAGQACDPAEADGLDTRVIHAHRHQRIGVAWAEHPEGPWTRLDHPILEPRPGQWDAMITTNPSPCVLSDGRVRLIYKSVNHLGGLMRLGLAEANRWGGPYQRVVDSPLLEFDDQGEDVEDPCLWIEAGQYHLVVKDMEGGIGGERRGGIELTSDDGITWDRHSARPAWSRTIVWDTGQSTTQDFLERPSILIQAGQATHLFMATGNGGQSPGQLTRTWNMVIPIAAKQ